MSCERARQIDQAAFRADPRASEWDAFRSHYPTCEDCSREVAAWSGLVAALHDEGDGASHPSDESLLQFESEPGRLPEEEREAIERHLGDCAPCRNELAVLRGFDFAALREPAAVREFPLAALAGPETETGPSLAERLRAAWGRLTEGLSALPAPALAFAAVLALAVPAAVLSWWLAAGTAPDAPEGPAIARRDVPQAPLAPPLAPRVPQTPRPETGMPPQPEAALAHREPLPEPEPEVAPTAEPEAAEAELETPPVPGRVAVRESPEPEPSPEVPIAPEPTPAPEAPDTPEPFQVAALLPDELPVYQPDASLVGGLDSVRIASLVRASSAQLPRIRALAPEHVGATASPSPVLYWDLGGASDVPVELTLIDEEAPEPLLDARVEPPVAAGLHALSLADRGVRLDPDKTYLWYAALVPDEERRENDVASGAGVRYVPLGDGLAARLEEAGPARRAHVLARAGYWYDAFATASGWLEVEPDAKRLRAVRDALLEQVGLD
jgi:hypothetical protein